VAPLLRFVISDLDMSRPESVAQLHGARLVPLADRASLVAVGPGADGGGAAGTAGSEVFVVSDDLELLLVGSQGAAAQSNAIEA
jgi:hypothetical protein